MKKIRYVVLLSLLLPACQIAVPSDPSGNSIPSASVSASSQINISVTPSPQDSSNLNTNNTGSPSSASPYPVEPQGSNSGSGNNPAPTPTQPHHDTMPGPNEAEHFTPTPKPYPTPLYSNNYSVPEGLNGGTVSLIFKDEFKVRYNREKKKFYSLVNADVSTINNIINRHNIIEVFGYFDKTEEQAEKYERGLEESDGYDYVNELSSYWFTVENTDLKAFIEEIRQNSLVRQANHNPGVVPD